MAMAAPAAASGARAAAGKAAQAGGLAKGKGDLPGRGDWRQRAKDVGGGKPKPKSKALTGSSGRYRRVLIAEFIVCVMLLGLAPLAKERGELGPVRFMKRGSATCALFIILGLISSGGRGAAKASAAFGGLVTLVLLVDQREAFGSLATVLAAQDDDDAEKAAAGQGPDDSADAGDGVVAV